mgnify:CR=1 FL=1|tara:strand:- start:388 stop:996 length:609 start_codon:yes stop_codon:yes gene_type:complete
MKVKPDSIVADAFTKEDTPAFILHALCLNKYGLECLDWEPETLWLEIYEDFHVDVDDSNMDKIQASIALIKTNAFYEDFQAFEGIGKAFNDQDPDFGYITPLTPEECAWAVKEAYLIDETPEEFSLEIKAYVREVLREHGFLSAPPELSFCSLGDFYKIESFVPLELKKPVMAEQKIKLKKVQLYEQFKKDKIAKCFKRYFS